MDENHKGIPSNTPTYGPQGKTSLPQLYPDVYLAQDISRPLSYNNHSLISYSDRYLSRYERVLMKIISITARIRVDGHLTTTFCEQMPVLLLSPACTHNDAARSLAKVSLKAGPANFCMVISSVYNMATFYSGTCPIIAGGAGIRPLIQQRPLL